jgi:ribose 5-phosphate isomerase B
MRIHLGANYEGYRTATALRQSLSAAGHEVIWHAAPDYDEGDGEVIAANKVNGGRVVAATDAAYAASARRHADVNGIVLPVVHLDDDLVAEIVTAFLGTEFARGYDDARRLVNIAEFETAGTIEGWMIEE